MEETVKRKKILVTGVAIALAAQISPASASTYADSGRAVTLTILHNNDGESALLPEQS